MTERAGSRMAGNDTITMTYRRGMSRLLVVLGERRGVSPPVDVKNRRAYAPPLAKNMCHLRLFGWRNGTHPPFCLLLATHCVMNSIPSTPSYTFGYTVFTVSNVAPAARFTIAS